MMDKLSGFDFAKRVRNVTETEETPMLFCSALSGEDFVVKGLNIGADDYVTKPFVIGEVLARVRAVLRRAGATAKRSASDIIEQESIYESDVTFRDLRIDRNDKECYLEGEKLPLTRTEFDILLFFLTHRNRIYSREEIIHNVWGDEVVVTERTIDTNITRLRKKLGGYDKYIVTRQGFGYGFKEKN
jgi:two-component system phosphate regulon response regulator PhoB